MSNSADATRDNVGPEVSSLGPAAIFRQHLDHIERGDIVQAKADYAEDAVLEADPTGEQGLLLAGTFGGHEAARGWVENWFSSFEPGSYQFDVEESIGKRRSSVHDPPPHGSGWCERRGRGATDLSRRHGARRADRATRILERGARDDPAQGGDRVGVIARPGWLAAAMREEGERAFQIGRSEQDAHSDS
jgi:hypothetical protein